jgi:hypothetical protein
MYIISGKSLHLIIVSFIVYIFVNMVENMIHYNIGRGNLTQSINFDLPTWRELLLIFIVMITFAGIQGLLTFFFNNIK